MKEGEKMEWQSDKIALERNRMYLVSATLGILKLGEPKEPLSDETWFEILKATRGHSVAMFKTTGQTSGWEIEFLDRVGSTCP